MANLTHWNPWRQIARWDPFVRVNPLEDVESMLREPGGVPDMRVDIRENTSAYTLTAELPGVDKQDINVSIDGNRVSITAQLRRETEGDDDKDGHRVCSERFYGHVHRSFMLDSDVDEARAEARFDNGVLRLTLPRKAGGQGRRLVIQ